MSEFEERFCLLDDDGLDSSVMKPRLDVDGALIQDLGRLAAWRYPNFRVKVDVEWWTIRGRVTGKNRRVLCLRAIFSRGQAAQAVVATDNKPRTLVRLMDMAANGWPKTYDHPSVRTEMAATTTVELEPLEGP